MSGDPNPFFSHGKILEARAARRIASTERLAVYYLRIPDQ
jgi:hypothetical protein